MNLKNQIFSAIAVIAISMVSFTSDLTSNAKATYNVDPAQSTIVWKGKKVTGEHYGNINVSNGKILVDGNKLIGGDFTIDMRSIKNTDLTNAEYNEKLVNHLKSDDFFGTEKHATSKFVIKEVTSKGNDKYDVKGDLTIKGITKPIAFPATITDKGNSLVVDANVVVDRSKFDVRYGSGSFFDGLGDKMIYDDFELQINLVAAKAVALN